MLFGGLSYEKTSWDLVDFSTEWVVVNCHLLHRTFEGGNISWAVLIVSIHFCSLDDHGFLTKGRAILVATR